MSLKVSEKAAFVTRIPEDTHDAICVGVFDIGSVFNGKYGKTQKKIAILWELPEVADPQGQPELINQYYTQSLAKNGALRPMLQGWRGRSFTDQELDEFDVSNLAGKACQLVVIHNESDNGSVFANIQAVTPWPKGKPKPKNHLPLMMFDFDQNLPIPDKCPENIRKKIEASPEWKARQGGGQKAPVANGAPPADDEDDDDIPF